MNEHTCTDADIYEIDGSACVSNEDEPTFAEEYMSCGGSERMEECVFAVKRAIDAFEAAADPASAEDAAKACAKMPGSARPERPVPSQARAARSRRLRST